MFGKNANYDYRFISFTKEHKIDQLRKLETDMSF
jgi:hypothetical protein